MKTKTLQVVFFDELEHAGLMAGSCFESVSYGDADYTLVIADHLAEELSVRGEGALQPLINELDAVPDGVYVALKG